MGFKCGIVGLPNVGKSTLFNALTETATAEAANYPFCTIEPNTGIVAVPDKRLKKLSELANSQKVIPAQMQFVRHLHASRTCKHTFPTHSSDAFRQYKN